MIPYLPNAVIDFADQSQLARQLISEYSPAAAYLHRILESSRNEKTLVGDFEILDYAPGKVAARLDPIKLVEWEGWLDEHGKLTLPEEVVKERIFAGGISAEVRPILWPMLLGVYKWDTTKEQREQKDIENWECYSAKIQQWLEAEENEFLQQEKFRIEKDIYRTDRDTSMFAKLTAVETLGRILTTYSMHDQDLGYVQGMSDLAAPILAVIKEESVAYACFESFMKTMRSNFEVSQEGMRGQLERLKRLVEGRLPRLYQHLVEVDACHLFFCYRWLLIWFKREYEWEKVLRLWEVCWAANKEFPLFVALAMLEQHQETFLQTTGFDELLANAQNVSYDLDAVLQLAESIYCAYHYFLPLLPRVNSNKEVQARMAQKNTLPLSDRVSFFLAGSS